MRILAVAFGLLILLIQWPLWLGKGGWLRTWDLDRQIATQKTKNGQLEVRNGGLAAEVRDLKQGTEAIEERARMELGFIRSDEVFFQFVEPSPAPAKPAPAKKP